MSADLPEKFYKALLTAALSLCVSLPFFSLQAFASIDKPVKNADTANQNLMPPPAINPLLNVDNSPLAPVDLTKPQLKLINDTIKQTRRKLHDLVLEMNRRQNEEKIGNLDQDPEYYDPYYGGLYSTAWGPGFYQDFLPQPLLPPRQGRLSNLMDELNYQAITLSKEIKVVQVPADVKQDLVIQWQVLKSTMETVAGDCQNLTTLTQGPHYDRVAIADLTERLNDNLSGLEDIASRIDRKL